MIPHHTTHRHYSRAYKAASAPTPAHAEHRAHMCHTGTSTEALLPDTLNTVTAQIRVFIPLLRNRCSRTELPITLSWALCTTSKPSQKAPLPDMAPGCAAGAPPRCPGSAGAPGIPGWTCRAGCRCALACKSNPASRTMCGFVQPTDPTEHSMSYLRFTCYPRPREFRVDIQQLVLGS